MDFITANGINWVLAVQSLGAWLESPMRLLSFLGDENFFFIVLPLIYWSIEARLGIRVAFILISSIFLNSFAKLLFATPRPYWISTDVNALSAETTFGIPSGHAQNAVALWGIMAAWLRRRWVWIAALTLAFLIGLSRLYLGLHFAADVLVGWLIGGLLLVTFITLWDRVSEWLKSQTIAWQVLVAFIVSLIMIGLGAWQVARLDGYIVPQEWIDNALRSGDAPNPVSMENFITSAGTLFGLAAGLAWINSRGGHQADGPLMSRILRYVIGLVGILVLWRGLGAIFPRDENLLSYLLRYFRYTLVGLWISAAAPWLFFHFKLSGKPKM